MGKEAHNTLFEKVLPCLSVPDHSAAKTLIMQFIPGGVAEMAEAVLRNILDNENPCRRALGTCSIS